MLISIEAENGAGKTSTIDEICKQLDMISCEYVRVKAPDYEGKHGQVLEQYLKGVIKLSDNKIDQLFKENRLEI